MSISLHIVSHCWNEELLMPGWVKWHQQFEPDSVTIIDHHSSDRTVGIIKELAPDWNIIPTRLEWFAAGPLDHEVSEVEASLPTSPEDWKITLNTTEYLWTPNLRERLQLSSQQNLHLQAFGARSISLVDIEPNDSLDQAEHTTGYIDYERGVVASRRWRYIHNQDYGHYHLGRHGVDLPATEMPDWFILHWHFAPFPNCKNRKQSINSRRPSGDIAQGLGVQHGAVATDEGFYRVYQEERARSFNLFEFPLYKEYYDYWKGAPMKKDYPNLYGVELEFKGGTDIAKAIEETIYFAIRQSDIYNVNFKFNGELYKVKRHGEIVERSSLWKQFEEWSKPKGGTYD